MTRNEAMDTIEEAMVDGYCVLITPDGHLMVGTLPDIINQARQLLVLLSAPTEGVTKQ
jgi:hypothetical protein